MNTPSWAGGAFQDLDALFTAHKVEPLSLCPDRTLATRFTELERSVVRPNLTPDLTALLTSTLEEVVDSMLRHFPGNIFWDFDFFVASVVRQALVEKDPAHFLKLFGKKVVTLMRLFGKGSDIHFRYLHDFSYGFDWARWVQKEPEARQFVQPFSLTFLDYLCERGRELLQLIAADDQKYHRIADDSYRNPFAFSRQPTEEAHLLTQLSRRQLLPLEAWKGNAIPVWNKPFERLREQLSSA